MSQLLKHPFLLIRNQQGAWQRQKVQSAACVVSTRLSTTHACKLDACYLVRYLCSCVLGSVQRQAEDSHGGIPLPLHQSQQGGLACSAIQLRRVGTPGSLRQGQEYSGGIIRMMG